MDTPKPISVLLVEGNIADAGYIEEILAKRFWRRDFGEEILAAGPYNVMRAASIASARTISI